MNMQIIAALLLKLHLLASLLNWCIYAARDSFSFCWISIKWLRDVWMPELQIFKWRQSLISSQGLSEPSASDTSMCTSPFDFACANLVLLSPVKSEAVSISMNQSSNCKESLPLKIMISCSKVFTKDVFFCAVHKVFVYCCKTSSMGSCGVDRPSVRANLLSLHSR